MSGIVNILGTSVIPMVSGHKKFYVSKDTGEVVMEETFDKLPTHEVEKDVGIDCKWLKDCVTEDDYKETIGVIDGWAYQPVKISHKILSMMMIEGEITVQQAKVLTEVCRNIIGWNIALVSSKALAKTTGVNGKNIARALKSMEPSTLKIVHRDYPNRGDMVLEINPMVAWKGGFMFRDDKLRTWAQVVIKPVRYQE